MYNTNFSTYSTARTTDRLICVWVPTGNTRMPLTCVWLEDKHYPANCIVRYSSNQQAPMQEGKRVQPCL
jgi:hypothetical protein